MACVLYGSEKQSSDSPTPRKTDTQSLLYAFGFTAPPRRRAARRLARLRIERIIGAKNGAAEGRWIALLKYSEKYGARSTLESRRSCGKDTAPHTNFNFISVGIKLTKNMHYLAGYSIKRKPFFTKSAFKPDFI